MNEGSCLIPRLEFGFLTHWETVSLATEPKMAIKVKFLDFFFFLWEIGMICCFVNFNPQFYE